MAERELATMHHRWKVAAVLCNRRPLCTAGNDPLKTDPLITTFKPLRMQHAESHLLHKSRSSWLDGATVYVLRMGFAGLLLAKPCQLCETALRNVGVKNVIYSTADGNFDNLKLY